tara:strand:+ start:370 stop:543 length:174 start_codon:yes stop_codon:yes gene_type:complete
MNITDAQYQKDLNDNINSITATINGAVMSIPLEPANRHYAEILKQVQEGTLTIQDAD